MEHQFAAESDVAVSFYADVDTTKVHAGRSPSVSGELRHEDDGSRPRWENRYIASLAVADATGAIVAVVASWIVRWSVTGQTPSGLGPHLSYLLLGVIVVPVWLLALVVGGAYDRTIVGSSPAGYSRIVRVTVGLFTVACALAFLGKVPLSRGLIGAFFPFLVIADIGARYVARKRLHRQRAKGHALHRIILVGDRPTVSNITSHLQRSAHAGYGVAGAYIPGASAQDVVLDVDVPVLGNPDDLIDDLGTLDIDAIAVSGGHLFEDESVRSLAWKLHGTGIQLLMAPDLAEIAGPRIVSRPAAGLPFLLVEEPQTNGVAQRCKALMERLAALAGIIVLSPLLAVITVFVKATGEGGVLFRQTRITRNGRPFQMLKFRSMVARADAQLEDLADNNDHDGVLFKIRDDPRVTRVGKVLRRFSLDELPQLWNVVRGDMAIVGPRPPLPDEVDRYEGDTGRRLMVKPGITGLWQVSGRSDLSWEDTVRLDLYYVENWSLSLDVTIMAKTLKAVLSGEGAY